MSDDIKIKVGVQSMVKRDMDKVVKDIKDGAGKASGSFSMGSLGKIGGFAAVVAGIKMAVTSAVEYADKISNIADNTDVSTKSIQNLIYAAKGFGVEAEGVEMSLSKVAKAQSDAFDNPATQKALKSLGIEIRDFVNMKPDEAFQKIGEALKKTGDNAAALDIVGKAGLKQIGFMKSLSDGIADVGLASESNIKAVDNFFDRISQGMIKLKALGVDKLGQLLKGDVGGLLFNTPEQEQGKTNAEMLNEQNAQFKKDAENQYKEKFRAANKEAQDRIDRNPEIMQGIAADKRAFENQAEGMGVKQNLFGRLAGRGDMTARAAADRESRMALDSNFRKSEKEKDREISREEKRGKALLKQAQDLEKAGRLDSNPRLKRILEADDKQMKLGDIEKNLKERELMAYEAQIAMQRDTASIKANSEEMKTLFLQTLKL